MARIVNVHDSMVFSEDQVLVRKMRIVVQHVPCSYDCGSLVKVFPCLLPSNASYFFRPCSLWVSGNHLLALLVSFQIALFS